MDAQAAALQETADYIAIRRLQDAYADIASRRAWPELTDIFAPDVTVTLNTWMGDPIVLTGPAAVGGWIAERIERYELFLFVVLNSRVYLRDGGDPDAAVARMFMNEVRQDRASPHFNMAYGVYHDRFRRIDGRWWFTARNYHSLARTGNDMELSPFPAMPAFPAA
jgi:hypothetical protein